MKRAARTDANQTAIVNALRAIGCTVFPLHMVGGGFPDIIVGYRGINVLLEIKDGNKPPSKRQLTPDEVAFFEIWQGCVRVAESPEEAINIMMEETV